MRVLVSTDAYLRLSRKAVERARVLGAAWASPGFTPLVGEPEHFAGHLPRDIALYEDIYDLPNEVPRHDPVLLQVFDELAELMVAGDEAASCLTVPDDVTYYVSDDGWPEHIVEEHRTWSPANGTGKAGTYIFDSSSRFS